MLVTPEREYYYTSEIGDLVGSRKATFYRRVKSGQIHKFQHEGQEVYSGPHVRAFLDSRDNRVVRQGNRPVHREIKRSLLDSSWSSPSDFVPLYVFDVEHHGMDRVVEPSVLRLWHKQNPYLTRVLKMRSHIVGSMTALPLPDSVILSLLKGDMIEREVSLSDIQYYQAGDTYSVYIPFAAVDEKYRKHLPELLKGFFDFWCGISGLSVVKLYTSSSSPEWDEVIGQYYFAPRYDLRARSVPGQPDLASVYELDLRRSNVSPVVKEVQEKMQLLPQTVDTELFATIHSLSKSLDDTITFEKASPDDLQACYEIDLELYGPGESNPVAVRQARYDLVSDGFYVLKDRGRVVAHTSFLPIDASELRRIRAGIPGRIPPEKISSFVIGRPLDLYFIIMSVKKGSDPDKRYGLRLLAGVAHVFRQLGAQGCNIEHIFAFSRTPDGIRICEGLGMGKEPFANDPERYMFSMSLQSGAPKIAREYQSGLAEYRARFRRSEFGDL